MTTRRLFLVQDDAAATVSLLRDLRSEQLASNYALSAALRPHLALINPIDLQTEADIRGQMEEIGFIHDQFAASIEPLPLSITERCLVLFRSLQVVSFHVCVRFFERRLKAELFVASQGKLQDYDPGLAIAKFMTSVPEAAAEHERRAAPQFAPSVLPKASRIELRSGKFEIGASSGGSARVELRYARKPRSPIRHAIRTTREHVRQRFRRDRDFRIELPAPYLSKRQWADINAWSSEPADMDEVLGKALLSMLRATVRDVRSRRPAIAQALHQHRRRLSGIDLNHASTAFNAAVLEAASTVGIETVLYNHGNVVAHGSPLRQKLINILAENSYNTHPCATVIAPLSPRHVPRGHDAKAVRLTGHVRPFALPPQEPRPLRVLLAPNFLSFLPWAVPGLVPSCYEAFAVVDFIARALAGRGEDFHLAIRIKSTISDVATADTLSGHRGLMGQHVSHLFDLADNIIDSNLGSYREAIETADLVITEGFSRVVFEALANRKPVLLANLSPDREPSIPSVSLSFARASERRFPVYHCGCNEEFVELLHLIRRLHLNRPLEDNELRDLLPVSE